MRVLVKLLRGLEEEIFRNLNLLQVCLDGKAQHGEPHYAVVWHIPM